MPSHSKAPSARHLCRIPTKTNPQPHRVGIFRSLRTATNVAPERSLICFATAIYKDASPTGFPIVRQGRINYGPFTGDVVPG
jgi:hypothetical protein